MPTYDTSDRYGLRALSPGSQPGSGVDDGFVALRDDVSAKLTPFDAGARSSRPRSTPVVPGIAGRTYRSADGGVDLDLGTSWVTVKPGLFAALPTLSGNAADGLDEGMEILFQTSAMATALVPPYLLRYDSTLSGASKWAVISAQAWTVTPGDSFMAGTVNTYVALGGTITLPVAGDWEVQYGGNVLTAAASEIWLAPGATGAAASDLASAHHNFAGGESMMGLAVLAGASGTLALYYKRSSSGSSGAQFRLSARPRRVG